MKRAIRNRIWKVLAAGLAAVLLAGCGGAAGDASASGSGAPADVIENEAGKEDAGGIVLNEPEYLGLSKYNELPEFRLSWNRYPDADGYEVAFYAEGEDAYGRGPFAVRSVKPVYDETTPYVDAEFLKGVTTDTVRYRMKVRPTIGPLILENADEYVWSNLWEIDFEDGEYTVRETSEDFDAEIAAEEDAEKQEQEPSPTPAAEKKDPLPHSFPESLADFLARERGEESLPLDALAGFGVTVAYDEYAEPSQTVTEERAVRQFADALQSVKVTGKKDEVFSTEGYTAFSGYDADGNVILGLSIQAGLLERNDGRYALEGADALFSIDGVMYAEDWAEYWSSYNEKADAYEEQIGDPEGMLLIEAAGYAMHRAGLAAPEGIRAMSAYIDWNREAGRFSSADPQEIEALWTALSKIRVGREEANPKGDMWHLNVDFIDPDDPAAGHAWIEFYGDYAKIGDGRYALEGIEELYDALDSDFFRYVRDYIDVPQNKPSY